MKNKTNISREENNFRAEQTILAMDLGTTTGWAVKHEYGIESGSVSFKTKGFEGGGMRYLRFQYWLADLLIIAGKIDVVYFEEVRRHLGVGAAHAYGGFLSHLTSWCEMNKIPYQGVPVGTIKRFITGKGNASKSEVIASVEALGHFPIDDNEADALALLHLAGAESFISKKRIIAREVRNEH